MENLTLERFLRDEGLREDLQRAAHRERAEHLHRLLAQPIKMLLARIDRPSRGGLRTSHCG
jgi:hypothetical protein